MSLDVYLTTERMVEVELFSANITHNLSKMAMEAGVYHALWRPEEAGYTVAADLISPLTEGLKRLKDLPDHFRQFNPSNGWGSYDGLVAFVEKYLKACQENPSAKIGVSR